MRQAYLLVRDLNFAESGNSYWKCEAYEITLALLQDEDDLKIKIREGHPDVNHLNAWTDPDQERALNLGRWWCEDHQIAWITTLEERVLPEALRLLVDAEVFTLHDDPLIQNATVATVVTLYKRIVYQFAQDIAQNRSNVPVAESFMDQYQEGVDVLRSLTQKVEYALALQYLRRHLRHPVIYEELMELSNFSTPGHAERFSLVCESYALDSNILRPLFNSWHAKVTEKVIGEAVKANPVKAVDTERQEWQSGVGAALRGLSARSGSMLRLDGLDWGKAAIKRHLEAILTEVF